LKIVAREKRPPVLDAAEVAGLAALSQDEVVTATA